MPTTCFSAKYSVPISAVSFSPKLLSAHKKSYKHLCIDFLILQGLLLVRVFFCSTPIWNE